MSRMTRPQRCTDVVKGERRRTEQVTLLEVRSGVRSETISKASSGALWTSRVPEDILLLLGAEGSWTTLDRSSGYGKV